MPRLPARCVCWARLCRGRGRWASAPHKDREAQMWEPLLDLEAAAPPLPDTSNEVADHCFAENSTCSGEELGCSSTQYYFRGFLVILWVYMIHTLMQIVINHIDQEDGGLVTMFAVFIALSFTNFFFLADKVLEEYTKRRIESDLAYEE